jgi:hypothetical protein
VVDGTYELFRHYYAVPSARDEQGREVGAVRAVGVGAGDDSNCRGAPFLSRGLCETEPALSGAEGAGTLKFDPRPKS